MRKTIKRIVNCNFNKCARQSSRHDYDSVNLGARGRNSNSDCGSRLADFHFQLKVGGDAAECAALPVQLATTATASCCSGSASVVFVVMKSSQSPRTVTTKTSFTFCTTTNQKNPKATTNKNPNVKKKSTLAIERLVSFSISLFLSVGQRF